MASPNPPQSRGGIVSEERLDEEGRVREQAPVVSSPEAQQRVERSAEILRSRGFNVAPTTTLRGALPSIRGPGEAAMGGARGELSMDQILERHFPGDAGEGSRNRVRRSKMLFDRNFGDSSVPDDQFAAAMLGQRSISGPPAGALVRTGLAAFGDTIEEQNLVFKLIHPNGEIKKVEGTDLVVFKKDKTDDSDQWAKLDPGILESVQRDIFLREGAIDIAEIGADVAANVAAEWALTRRVKPPGAPGVLPTMFRLFAANVGAEAAEEAGQLALGTSRESATEVLRRGAFEGTMAVGTGLGFLGARAVGRRVFGQAEEAIGGAAFGAKEALEASERLGIDPPPVTRLSDQPFVQAFGRLSSRFNAGLNRYEQRVRAQTLARGRALVNDESADLFIKTANEQLETSSREIVDFVENTVKRPELDPVQAGNMLADGVDRWRKASTQAENGLYTVARKSGDPTFDLSTPVESSRRVLERKVTPGKAQTVERETGLFGPNGNPIMETVSEVTNERIGITPTPKFKRLLEKMQRIDADLPDPDLPEGVKALSRTDRIRELQKEFSDLADWGNPQKVEEAKIAGRLWKELDNVLDNPTGGDPAFKRRWGRAREFSRNRRTTEEQMAISDIVFRNRNRGTPEMILSELSETGGLRNLSNFRTLRKILKKSEWREFKRSVHEKGLNLLKKPDDLDRMLDEMHPDVRSILFDRAEERALRSGAEKWRAVEATNLPKTVARQTQRRSFVRDLIHRRDTAGISALHAYSQSVGGLRSRWGQQLRHAIMDEMLDTAKTFGKNLEPAIDAAKMQKVIKDYGEAGLLKFLEGGDLPVLRDTKAASALLKPSIGGAGESIAGTEAVSQVVRGSLDTLKHLAKFKGLSWLLTRPGISRFIIARAQETSTGPPARDALFLGAIFGNLVSSATGAAETDSQFSEAQRIVSLAGEGTQ